MIAFSFLGCNEAKKLEGTYYLFEYTMSDMAGQDYLCYNGWVIGSKETMTYHTIRFTDLAGTAVQSYHATEDDSYTYKNKKGIISGKMMFTIEDGDMHLYIYGNIDSHFDIYRKVSHDEFIEKFRGYYKDA